MLLSSFAFSSSVFSHDETGVQPIYSLTPVEQTADWAVQWWKPRHQEKLEAAKKSDVELLMLGDSITHGWENGGLPVWNKYFKNSKAFNLGFSGDRTEHVLWRIENGAFDNLSPKLTVLMIGTNNTGHRMDPAEHTAEGIKKIVSEIRSRMPESKVLLLGIFPRNLSPFNDMRKRNDHINKLISQLDDGKHIYYLNINQIFLDDKGQVKAELMPDLLHPNQQGYQVWAEVMAPRIKQLMDL